MNRYSIAVVHGDGIGPEVCRAALEVLAATPGVAARLDFHEHPGGADHYRATGSVLPDATLAACRDADAILHGAAGLPGRAPIPTARKPAPTSACSCASGSTSTPTSGRSGCCPASCRRCADKEPGQIDYVIVRENTEGLYAARDSGVVLRDEVATDALVMTRKGIERICVARVRAGPPAPRRAARRQAARDLLRQGRTCCAATPSSAACSTRWPTAIPTSSATTRSPTR